MYAKLEEITDFGSGPASAHRLRGIPQQTATALCASLLGTGAFWALGRLAPRALALSLVMHAG